MFQPTRRTFLKSAAGAAVAPTLLSTRALAADSPSATNLPKPTPAQVRWQKCEMGVIYHLDMPTVAGLRVANNATRKILDPQLYNPKQLDTDQWLAAAKAAGAKYAVFTATHFNGFMQWQSDLYPYSLKQAAWRGGKGDIVADFVESCRKADILPGIYLSTHRNAYQTVWGHYVNWGKGRGTEKQAAYNRIAERQTEELCSRYGDLVQIWYDAGVKTPEQGGPDVLPIFEEHQPDSVFYHNAQRSDHRWIGNEAGHAGYPCWATMPGPEQGELCHNSPVWRKCLHRGDPNGTYWSPGMVDVPLRHGRSGHDWFYHTRSNEGQIPTSKLLTMYDRSVGRNATFVLGLVIDPEGLVPEPDMKRMEEFGSALQTRFSKPVGQTAGRGNVLELRLDKPHPIGQIIIQEDITGGERIRKYEVDALVGGDKWRKIAEGQSVGHKRIERVEPIEVAALRLRATETQAEPIVCNLTAYGASDI